MGAVGKKVLAACVLAVGIAAMPARADASPVTFDPVTIGVFGWELIPEDPFDFDYALCGADPCIRFWVTNLMTNLQGDTGLLDLLGLSGFEEFEDATLVETGEALGTLIPGDGIFRPIMWTAATATLAFGFPAITNGTLFVPSFTLDLENGAVNGQVPITIQAVPEPATLGLVAIGLGAAYARRRHSRR
jgi:hypothetical protein